LHRSQFLPFSGDSIFLTDPNGRIVDAVTFGRQTHDVSQGRWPDGYGGPPRFMRVPSPLGSNRLEPETSLQTVVSSLALEGVTLAWNSRRLTVETRLCRQGLTAVRHNQNPKVPPTFP
jgi:hypothetical protein